MCPSASHSSDSQNVDPRPIDCSSVTHLSISKTLSSCCTH